MSKEREGREREGGNKKTNRIEASRHGNKKEQEYFRRTHTRQLTDKDPDPNLSLETKMTQFAQILYSYYTRLMYIIIFRISLYKAVCNPLIEHEFMSDVSVDTDYCQVPVEGSMDSMEPASVFVHLSFATSCRT